MNKCSKPLNGKAKLLRNIQSLYALLPQWEVLKMKINGTMFVKMKSNVFLSILTIIVSFLLIFPFHMVLSASYFSQDQHLIKSYLDKVENVTPSSVNSPGNLHNGGAYAHDGNYLYYANANDQYKLYKMRSDGREKQKLNDDASIYINLHKEWLIYYSPAENVEQAGIYRIKKDGSEKKLLWKGKTCKIMLVDEYIYFHGSQGKFQKMDINGKNLQTIASLPTCLYFIEDDFLFSYKTPYGIHRVNLKNTDDSQLLLDYVSYAFLVQDDSVYYSDLKSKQFKRLILHSKQTVEYPVKEPVQINVENDTIFFIDQNYHIYRMNKDGSQLQKLNEDISYRLHIVDGWIYYEKFQHDPLDSSYTDNSSEPYRMMLDGSRKMKLP
jgi:hypothetical protein